MHYLDKPIAVIDFEASGLTDESYPISVGVYTPNEKYYALIKPVKGWTYWSWQAQAEAHKINRPTIERQGKPVQEVAENLNALAEKYTLVCDSSYHDGFWCQRLFTAANSHQGFNIENFQALFSNQELQLPQFYKYRKEFAISEQGQLHHALFDAKIIYLALQKALFDC